MHMKLWLVCCPDTSINNLNDDMGYCSQPWSCLLNIPEHLSRVEQVPFHFTPQLPHWATDSDIFSVINTCDQHFWSGVLTGCLQIYVVKHGPVNIYGAEESKERCNNPPWAVRRNPPFWCTTALREQTPKLCLLLSQKQHPPQCRQKINTDTQKSTCLLIKLCSAKLQNLNERLD